MRARLDREPGERLTVNLAVREILGETRQLRTKLLVANADLFNGYDRAVLGRLERSAGGRSSMQASSRRRSKPPDQFEPVHHLQGRNRQTIRSEAVDGAHSLSLVSCAERL